MQHFKTITKYCQAINISQPKHTHFDIRSFDENMPTVIQKMSTFRHEFYAIAIKVEGKGKAISGHFQDFPEGASIFFNSPFQLLSWDIAPDWQGYYLVFSQDFLVNSKYLQNLLQEFPFLKIDKSIPFQIEAKDLDTILNIYKNIYQEYYENNQDKFQLIEAQLLLLLNYVRRYFNKQVKAEEINEVLRKADLKLLSRFQNLIETSFYPDAKLETFANIHSPSYYAEKLNIHPNHLNAVVKEITGQTASKHIQNHILQLAKSYLLQSNLSVKEIAYTLYFDSPNNFSTFFKKHTQMTALKYRQTIESNI